MVKSLSIIAIMLTFELYIKPKFKHCTYCKHTCIQTYTHEHNVQAYKHKNMHTYKHITIYTHPYYIKGTLSVCMYICMYVYTWIIRAYRP